MAGRICLWLLLGAGFAIASHAGPGLAQQPAPGPDFPLAVPRAADTGKALIFESPAAAVPLASPQSCPLALVCGVRIVGAVQKNGAVEATAPVLRW